MAVSHSISRAALNVESCKRDTHLADYIIGKYKESYFAQQANGASAAAPAVGGAALDSNRKCSSAGSAQKVDLRADRWAQRREVRRILRGTTVAKCGTTAHGGAVGLYWDSKHGSRFGGLLSCGSVWCCPVCNHKIQTARQHEIQQLLQFAADAGYGVVFATYTLRHTKHDELKDLVKAAQTVWSRTRSHRCIKKLFVETHEIDYVRAMEITYSRVNGWHVHFHVYFLFEKPLSHADFRKFDKVYSADWVNTATKIGMAAPRLANQKFEQIDLTQDVEANIAKASKYCTLTKVATTPKFSKLGHEITDTQSKIGKVKTHANGRKVLHLTYWDFIRILTDKRDISEHTLSAFMEGL
ncbi:protein rep [Pseudoscardovia suis]